MGKIFLIADQFLSVIFLIAPAIDFHSLTSRNFRILTGAKGILIGFSLSNRFDCFTDHESKKF